MKKHLFLFNTACIFLAFTLSGCHTSRKAVSRQPGFIDDVYMNRHKKSNTAIIGGTDIEKTPANITPSDDVTDYTLTKKEASSIRKKYAEMLGAKPKEIDNNTLFSFIDSWYGVNYHLGGCNESGIDCSAFVQKLYRAVYGIDIARTTSEQYSKCKRIHHTDDANEGDLVFFHVHSRRISHVGIYLFNDYFVHVSTSQGVVISSLNDEYWHKRYACIGRVEK